MPWSDDLRRRSLSETNAWRLRSPIPILEQGLAIAREHEFELSIPHFLSSLGLSYALDGRAGEGLPLLDDAVARAEQHSIRRWQSVHEVRRAEACLLAERLEDATRSAEAALALVRARGERGTQGWALRILGEVALARRDQPRAQMMFRDALEIATALEMRRLEGDFRLGLGHSFNLAGDRREAEAELTRARALFKAMELRPRSALANSLFSEPSSTVLRPKA